MGEYKIVIQMNDKLTARMYCPNKRTEDSPPETIANIKLTGNDGEDLGTGKILHVGSSLDELPRPQKRKAESKYIYVDKKTSKVLPPLQPGTRRLNTGDEIALNELSYDVVPYETEEGNLRFRCEYTPGCKFSDERASKVEIHIRGVHLNLRYKCALYWCSKTVYNKAEIMTHLENHHHYQKILQSHYLNL